MRRISFAFLFTVLLVATSGPPASGWVTEVVDHIPTGGSGGEYASLAVDSSGFVHICSQNESLGGLQYTTNASGTWVSTIIDGTTHGDIGSHASIAVDSADRVHISYKGDAGLEYATNASGAWLTRVVHVDPLRSTGSSTSIAVDSSDKVHISYLSTVGMDTMYLSYTTNAFGSWQKVTLDSGPYSWPEVLNNYTSIAVDGCFDPATRGCSASQKTTQNSSPP